MSRPLSKSGLDSATERELVWWTAKGLGKEEAAKRAGLPSTAGLYRYTRTKAFADDLRQALTDRMSTELAPKAVEILNSIMTDEKVHPRVRVDAAKALLDRSGYSATAAAADMAKAEREGEKSLSEMTKEELMRIVLASGKALGAEREALLKAKTIEGKVAEASPLDYFLK